MPSITYIPSPTTINQVVTGSNGKTYKVSGLSPLTMVQINDDSDLVDNGNNTFTHTDSEGNSVTIDFNETLTSLVDNGDGTLTYTDENGTGNTVANNRLNSSSWDGTTRTLTMTLLNGATISTVLSEAAISNVIAGNRIATYTKTDGSTTDIDETITTLTSTGGGNFTYVNEAGTNTNISNDDISAVVYDATSKVLTITTFSGNTFTTLISEPFINGTVAGHKVATFNSVTGATTNINETVTSLSYNAVTSELTFVDEGGTSSVVNLSALTTDIYIGGGSLAGSVLTLTDNSGTTPNVVLDLSGLLSSWVNNGDGTYTHDDGTGSTFNLDLNATNIPYNNTTSGMAAADVQSAINELNTTAQLKSVVTDNGNDTWTHSDGHGTTVLIDASAASTAFDNTVSGLTSTNVKAAIDEIVSKKPVATNNLATYQFSHNDSYGTVTTIDYGFANIISEANFVNKTTPATSPKGVIGLASIQNFYKVDQTSQTAWGYQSGGSGTNETAVGFQAVGSNVQTNITGIGYNAGKNNTGIGSTFLGSNAGSGNTFNNVSVIGGTANADIDNQIVLGNTSILEVKTAGRYKMGIYIPATLPPVAGNIGSIAYVTGGLGGGRDISVVQCDGTNWRKIENGAIQA